MARLIERTVQDKALVFLTEKYRKKAKNNLVFADIEVKTKKEYGSKRADGLIAYRHAWWGNVQVASIEAKSFKTLPAMKPYRNNWKWIKNSIVAGILFCIASGAFFHIFKGNSEESAIYLVPILFFLAGLIGYSWYTKNSFKHKDVDVIDQLKQYPSNYQWLAFSQDSIDSLGQNKTEYLLSICRSQGIGIVIVGTKNKVKTQLKPKKKSIWKMSIFKKTNDYLAYYSTEERIREFIT